MRFGDVNDDEISYITKIRHDLAEVFEPVHEERASAAAEIHHQRPALLGEVQQM